MMIVSIASIHVDDAINVSRGGRPITDNDVGDLAMDIKQNGLLEELGVIRLHQAEWYTPEQIESLVASGKSYVLIYGFRRLHACRIVGFRDVKTAEIGDDVSLAQAELANIAENWGRRQPNEYDLMIACARFVNVHKTPLTEISLRTQKPIQYIEESVSIATRVNPQLLQHYRANCSREVRRKMLALAAIDDPIEYTRHQKQNEHWMMLEAAESTERRSGPHAGTRTKKTNGQSKKYLALVAAARDVLNVYGASSQVVQRGQLHRAMMVLEELVRQ